MALIDGSICHFKGADYCSDSRAEVFCNKQIFSVLGEPFSNGQGHGFKPLGISRVEAQGAAVFERRVVLSESRF